MITAIKRKDILIIMIISITMFLISISISLIIGDMKQVSDYNNMYFENNIKINIFTNKKDIIDDIVKNKDISVMSDNSEFLSGSVTKGIYFKGNSFNIPIEEGRNFTAEDIERDNRAIIISRDYQDLIIKENDKSYIDVFGNLYEVIGVTGNDLLKYNTFVNLDLIDDQSIGDTFIVSSNVLSINELSNIVNIYNEKIPNVIQILEGEVEKRNKNDVLERYSEIISVYKLIILISIISLITSTLFLVEKMHLELSVKILCGADKKSIFKELIKKITTIGVISISIAALAQLSFNKFIEKVNISGLGYYDLSIYNFMFMLMVIILFCVILIFSSFKFINNQKVSCVLKEG